MTAIKNTDPTIWQQLNNSRFIYWPLLVCGVAFLGLTQPIAMANDTAPPANVASPDVYKVLAENDQFRVLEATWQPGQEDNYHSHPADRVSLYRTDCTLRLTSIDGRIYCRFPLQAQGLHKQGSGLTGATGWRSQHRGDLHPALRRTQRCSGTMATCISALN